MAQDDPAPLSADILASHFPLETAAPAAGVFELGLALGGTVSAGAYTGGVLDFLLQALDAWELAKADPKANAPRHKVVITDVGGASGGAINGALLLRAAGRAFPPGANANNLFYTSWTQGVDLQKLLAQGSDTAASALRAIFNCDPIEAQAKTSVAFPGAPLGTLNTPAQRSYFADPLRLTMMVTDLTGLPYRISMTGNTSLAHDMVAHGDWLRFALHVPGGAPDPLVTRNDEFALSSTAQQSWDLVAGAATCTSAFPFAFRAQSFARPLDMFGYRVVLVPDTEGKGKVVPLTPLWDELRQGPGARAPTKTVNLDGGVTDNDALDMVRTALAGMAGRNPRTADLANRAVLMVSPFSDAETLGPADPPGLLKLIQPFINGLVMQARFKPADLAMAQDETIFSRFLIAPVGPDKTGKMDEGAAVLASGGLGGFLGFVDPGFLTYDFLLGRWNAYRFLQNHFVFSADNTVFKTANFLPPEIDDWCLKDAAGQPQLLNGQQQLPMIPLMDGVVAAPPGAWPALPAVPSWLDGAIKSRLDLLVAEAKTEVLPSGFGGGTASVLISAVWALCGGWVRGAIVGALTKQLQDAGLVPKSPAPPPPAEPNGRGG